MFGLPTRFRTRTLATGLFVVVVGSALGSTTTVVTRGEPTATLAHRGGLRAEQADSRFLVEDSGAARATNTAHGFEAHIDVRGLAVSPASATLDGTSDWTLTLTTNGLGRGDAIVALETCVASADAARADLDRGSVREWFTNDERGLEQSWSIAARPDGDEHAEVALQFTVGGSLSLHIAEDGLSGTFVDPRGRAVLRYHSLAAWDAHHRALPVRMVPGPNGPRILVEDVGAAYPITIDPMLSGPYWYDAGEQNNEAFGAALSTAGDVNGDGYSDFLVSAPFFDGGQTDEGRVALYLGTASGPANSVTWNVEGNQSNALCGSSVSPAGDVNADGYDDVLVGLPGFDGGLAFEGKVDLYLGSASGLATTPAWTAEGNQANARFGISVSMAGDVNADGFGDVVIGAKWFDNGEIDEGSAFLYLGTVSGLAAAPAWTTEGNEIGAEFGASVCSAGDVNGDGFADVIVGAPRIDNGAFLDSGSAFVFHGSATGLASTPARELGAGPALDGRFGSAVARAGDVNGDGFGDVLVGSYAWGFGHGEEGYAWLYLGSSGGVAATPVWHVQGNQIGAHLGVSLATAGDVNGDGFADVVVGADGYKNPAGVRVGRVQVFLGSASALSTTAAWSALGIEAGSFFGGAVATAGDVNGDGFSDVLVSDRGLDYKGIDTGRVSLYFGGTDALPSTTPAWDVVPVPCTPDDYFGWSVAFAGDVNADGFTDVLVGAPWESTPTVSECGVVRLYLGSVAGLASTPAWTSAGDSVNSKHGFHVASAGDVNGDGFDDVLVGDNLQIAVNIVKPNVSLYLGGIGGLAAIPVWRFEHSFLATPAGDVNADGFADVVVVTQDSNQGPPPGRVLLYLGSSSGLLYGPASTLESGVPSDGFGYPVASAGDVNGDGYCDLVVAAPYDWHDHGRVYFYLGTSSGFSATPASILPGDGNSHFTFGFSLASGDLNQDGYSDVLVGDPWHNSANGSGRVTAYFGSVAGLATTPGWEIALNVSEFGTTLASAGDVNGDGRTDILVGSVQALHLYLGASSGPATSAGWSAFSADSYPIVAGPGDVDGNGISEVLYGSPGDSSVCTGGGRASLCSLPTAGARPRPRQARTASAARIGLFGSTDPANTFVVQADATTGTGSNGMPAGRGRVRVEWEVKPQGQTLNGTNLQRAPTLQDTGQPGGAPFALSGTVTGLVPQGRYHWRARVATDDPCFPHSRWVSIDGNALNEMKLRMVCDPAVLTPDCNGNGIGDACDISTAATPDCDHNGTPDSCELVGRDCDGNGVLDVCDIAAGAPDVDSNGILDACEPAAFCFGDGSLVDHTTPCPCGNNGAPGNGCGHSFDPFGASLIATGQIISNDVVLRVAQAPVTSFTLFLQHDATGDMVFHDGVLCAGGTLIRLRGRAAVSGEASFPNSNFAQDSTTTLSQRGNVTIGSGARRYYSAWYRNAATTFCPPKTANVTNGIRIDW